MPTTETLWHEYRNRIFRFFAARVKNNAVAEDLTQEVFVRIHRNLPALKEKAALAGWVFQIARNALADHYRKSMHFSPLPPQLPDERDEAAEATRAARENLENCLAPLIDALEEPYKNAVKLADLQGLSQRELAACEGLTLPGAKSRVQRGRAKLRRLLEQCCEFETDRQGNVEGFRVRDPESNCCASFKT
ncbi:MAG: RNA polymerase sigma factor SigZ [Campylobacterales bacterium]